MTAERARALRLRIVVVATALVAAALVVVSLVVVAVVRQRLTAGVDAQVELRAQDLIDRVEATNLPAVLTTFGDPQDVVAQVVADDQVVAATANFEGAASLGVPCDSGPRSARFPSVDSSTYRAVTRCRTVRGVDFVVHAAINLDDVEESSRALVLGLGWAFPGLLIVLAGSLWWLVGRLLRRVVAASDRESQFVADAAHELRSPLARMVATLEIDGADGVESVLADARRLGRLVDDLLAASRLDADVPMRRELVDLDDVVLRVTDAVRPVTPHLVLGVESVSGGQVRGDALHLERMVANLVDNAARHALSKVDLGVSESDDGVTLTVADDGPGVEPSLRPHVFDRFRRGDDVRTPGTDQHGLGLAIVREIVERHGGAVHYEDADPGARFVVTLPTARSSR